MPSAMVDATVATPPLDLTGRRRRSAALSNSNAGCGAAALSNANAGAVAAAPKPKPKTVASRYLTTSAKPTSTSSSVKSRPVLLPSAVATDVAASTATTRTLAVAFQSPTYSLDTSRARSVSPAAVPAIAPEKRRPSASGTAVRAKVSDGSQNTYRWPASATAAPCGHDGRAVTKSLHHSAPNKKATTAISGAVRSTTAFDGTPRRASVDGANEYLLALSSDTDSASSGGSADGGAHRPGIASGPRASPRSIMSSSVRFSRDAVGTRSERFAYAGTPFKSCTSAVASPAPVKKRSLFKGLLSSPFSRPSLKQPSPIKPVASSLGRTASPSRPRRSMELPSTPTKLQSKVSAPGCSLDGDMKLKAAGAAKAEEEHQLRLLYTRHLQWRHVNAQAAAALSSQTMAAEKTLCGAWLAILRMRKSVAIRKMQLQLLRNNCKVVTILMGQMKYLDEWSSLERTYTHSLSGSTRALNATVLRLPVSNGAIADIQAVKNVLSSAVNVMQTIGNSTSTQLPKLARTNLLVTQLCRVAIQEQSLMAQCRELLSTLASMHVKYSSLQGQRMQLNQTSFRRFQ